ncbi:hypothetical protein BDR07DRAFT_1074614 [Suillus spraguei]|nr:hypothetical protein BDR07DRAFT_1074614 [Suillus spraguei]
MIVKTLNFESKDLGIDVNLLLTFDDQSIPGLYKTCHPSAFAVRKFGSDGQYRSSIVYRSQLAFTKVVVSRDVIQSASPAVPVDVGQSTILTKEGGTFHFSHPKTDPSVPKGNIQCTNNAPFKEDIGVGFIEKEGGVPKTTLVWSGIGHGHKVDTQFTPILRGYIVADYEENSLIKGQVEFDRSFEQNLADLEDETTWEITYDHSTGATSIDKK